MPYQSPRTVPARSLLEIVNYLNAAKRILGEDVLTTYEVVHLTGFTSAHISAQAQANRSIEVPPSARMALKLAYRGIAEVLEMGQMDQPSINKAAMYEAFIANDMKPVAPPVRVNAKEIVELFGAIQHARALNKQKPVCGSIIPSICGISGNTLEQLANDNGFVDLNDKQQTKLKEAFAGVPEAFRTGGAEPKLIKRADEFAKMLECGFRVTYPAFGKPRPASA